MYRWLLLIIALTLVPLTITAQVSDDGKPVKVVTDVDIDGLTYWSSDTVWNLSGFCYVEDGEVLIIDPGTIIKSNPGQKEDATALIVARGGRIYAEGTKENPIIFTSISDDVDDPYDIPLPPSSLGRALWGGLVMLGQATIADPAGENDIEGLPVGDSRNLYGGTDDDDNSGVLKYVSIRHGGSKFSDANEINGLTLGGVGRGTTIDYVEVFANLDDGVELFGGTVNVKHMVLAFGGDDQLDYDEGWRGGAQFVFTIADTLDSDCYGEHDGADSPEDQTPYATPLLSNVTAIGVGNASASINSKCFNIRDNAGGAYFNSLFAHHKGTGIRVEDLASGHDSRERLSVGDLKFENNFFWDIQGGLYSTSEPWVDDSIFSGVPALANTETDPQFDGIDWGPNTLLDPVPNGTSPAAGTWVDPVANFNPPANPSLTWTGFFETVDYMGAFEPGINIEESWVANWSFLHCAGYFGDVSGGGCCIGIRGNANSDPSEALNISDITYLVAYCFGGGPAPECSDEGNVNGDGAGAINISDITYLVAYCFGGGPEPPACP